MQKCRICGGSDFYKEAGYFFCQTCQTQNEEIREEVLELRVDATTRLRKTRIRKGRSDQTGEELGWTTWELYNFVLIGLTNELIELGAPSDIKLTVLQLWATYLGNIEVAFISTKKKCVPKLAKRYNKRDAEIIYGKIRIQKKSRRSRRTGSSTTSMASGYQSDGSSMRELNKNKKLLIAADYERYVQSQTSTEGDGISTFSQSLHSVQSSSAKSSDTEGKVQYSSHAKEEINKLKKMSKNLAKKKRAKYRETHVSTQYKIGPHLITPMRLWAILYLALRIHNQPIHLGDMLRYGREGHLSYYKLDHLLPPEVVLTKSETNFLSQNVEITHKGMRRIIASMAKFLGVWEIRCPDFAPLVSRYCQELALPRGIQLYTEKLIALAPPKMKFDARKPYIPNYEGRAMAFIIVVLKILLALDGITEYQISRVAEKINRRVIDRGLLDAKLFNFQEWQRYIECRKTILVHSHFPTKLKYSSDAHGIDGLYIKFLDFINSKRDREEPEITNHKHFLPEELVSAMKRYMYDISGNDLPPKEIDIFAASLTPLHSYLQQLLNDPLHDLPSVARTDFFFTKVGYMAKPYHFKELAAQCNIELDIITSNLHFVEKVVPPFEQPRMPSTDELNEPVEVRDDTSASGGCAKRSENLNDYVHTKIPCKIRLNAEKERCYDKLVNAPKSDCDLSTQNKYSFNDTLASGRLAIPSDSDSESEDEDVEFASNNSQETKLLKKSFCDKYNLRLSEPEKKAVRGQEMFKYERFKRKTKLQPLRDAKGQFVKGGAVSTKIESDSESESGIPSDIVDFALEYNINRSAMDRAQYSQEIGEKSLLAEDIDLGGALPDTSNYFNLSQISLFAESAPEVISGGSMPREKVQFFRPFRDYWMYHCIFSRVKPKNFEQFEKALPRTFRWLLDECAHIVEMPVEDLYEEICLIESYHAQVLNPTGSKATDAKSKNQSNVTLNKW